MKSDRRLTYMDIRLHFDDGNNVNVLSPVKVVKLGFVTKIGWGILLFGAWIMFRNRKRWQTIYR